MQFFKKTFHFAKRVMKIMLLFIIFQLINSLFIRYTSFESILAVPEKLIMIFIL